MCVLETTTPATSLHFSSTNIHVATGLKGLSEIYVWRSSIQWNLILNLIIRTNPIAIVCAPTFRPILSIFSVFPSLIIIISAFSPFSKFFLFFFDNLFHLLPFFFSLLIPALSSLFWSFPRFSLSQNSWFSSCFYNAPYFLR